MNLIVKTALFWNVRPHRLVDVYRHFIGISPEYIESPIQKTIIIISHSTSGEKHVTKTLVIDNFTLRFLRYEIGIRNKKIIMFLGSKVRRVRRADLLTTICEPIV
jgi:hypothetical protein